jgi:tRNA 2-thiouridine synthesizing protein A
VPKFCAFLGHELIASEERDGVYIYLLRKGEE